MTLENSSPLTSLLSLGAISINTGFIQDPRNPPVDRWAACVHEMECAWDVLLFGSKFQLSPRTSLSQAVPWSPKRRVSQRGEFIN